VKPTELAKFSVGDTALINRVTFNIKTPRWKNIAADSGIKLDGKPKVTQGEKTVAVSHSGLIGDAQVTQYRLVRTVTAHSDGRVRVNYETTWTAGTGGNPYYTYIVAHLPRDEYVDATVRANAMRRRVTVTNRDGKRENVWLDFEGKPQVRKFGGSFDSTCSVELPERGWQVTLLRGVRNASLPVRPYGCFIEMTSRWGNRGMGTYAIELDFSRHVRPPRPVQTAAPDAVVPATSLEGQRARVCLNGVWRFRPAGGDSFPPNDCRFRQVRVPFSLTRTQNCFDLPTHVPSGWYVADFPVPADWGDGRRVYLTFDRVAYHARLWINDQATGSHAGHCIPWRTDITEALTPGKAARAFVHVRTAHLGVRGRRNSGVWGNVWLESRPPVQVSNVFVKPSVRRKRLIVWTWVTNSTPHVVEADVTHRVMDGPQPALKLARPKLARLLPGETRMVSHEAKWPDPKLWGFEPYGTPHLYTLVTTLRAKYEAKVGKPFRASSTGSAEAPLYEHTGPLADRHCQRFGFRELWTDGPQFMFNGKPFFIKGDLVSSLPQHCWNRAFAAIFYHAERAANINFIRWHESNFPPDEWLDVADELGMLIEPQQYMRCRNESDLERLLREWDGFVPTHWNHPCIVMYSADNEACSQGDWGQPEVVHVDETWRMLDRVHRRVKALDDTRLVEEHGDVRLATAVNAGKFGGLDVFSPHPYGNPLGKAMTALSERYGYRGDVPIHVGEIYVGSGDPHNSWTRPAEIARRKAAMTLALRRYGKYYARSILSVRDAGARGASLCSGESTLYFGVRADGSVSLGPFDPAATDEHFFTEKASDRGVAVNLKTVSIGWPSLSGVGVRAPQQNVSLWYGGQFNFHDGTKLPNTTNLAHDAVRDAFKQADGQDVGPLAATRAAEVVVCVGKDGSPAPNAIVWAHPLEGQPASSRGVLSDADGCAWFVLHHGGRYRFSCPRIVGSQVAHVQRPPFGGKPGWAFIQWVDLGEAKSDVVRRQLALPADEDTTMRLPQPNNRATPPAPPPPRLGKFSPDGKGFITDWLAFGPLPNAGDRESGFDGFKTDWFRDVNGEASLRPKHGDERTVRFQDTDFSIAGNVRLRWRDLHIGPKVLLDSLTAPEVGMDSQPPMYAVAYAFCWVLSPTTRDVEIAVGSDDGHAVWLNHQMVGADPTHGGARPDERRYKAQLRKGPNALMVKIDQSFGGWAFYLRFLQNGEPVRNVDVVLAGDEQ